MIFQRKFTLIVILLFMISVCFAKSLFAAPVTVKAVETDVKSLLFSIAKAGNINLAIDGDVSGKITVNINGLEPMAAIYTIASARGFVIEEKYDSIIITNPNNSVSLRQIYTFPVHHAELATIEKALNIALRRENADTKNASSKSTTKVSATNKSENYSRVMIAPTHNAVILYGTPKEAQTARALIESIDTPPKQISLMAKIVALQKDASKDLGVEWRWSALPQYPESRVVYEYEYVDGESTRRRRTTTREFDREFEGSDNIPGIIRFGKGPEGYPYEFYYEAKINALITDGKAKILSQPNITTLNGKEAVINIGGSVPVPTLSTTNSTVTTSIQYKDAGIILKYTPRAGDDGYITADVHTEVSSPLYVESLKAYRFQERSADTTVRLRNNETMVIGGLIGEEESKSFSKVPFLGDLPILGAFFRNNRKSKSESELVIFLTAKILDDEDK